jgi:hypothetical protein
LGIVGKTAKDSLKPRNAILGTVMAGSKGRYRIHPLK